jgi:ankyrin repeat protein
MKKIIYIRKAYVCMAAGVLLMTACATSPGERLVDSAWRGEPADAMAVLKDTNNQIPKEALNLSILPAVNDNNIAMVKDLLDRGADIDFREIDYRNVNYLDLRHVAGHSFRKRSKAQAPLLEQAPLLIIAVEKGYLDMVKLLLERGAHVHAADLSGNTALMIAKRNNNTAIIDLLNSHNPAYVQFQADEKIGDDAVAAGNFKNAFEIYVILLKNPYEDRARLRDKIVSLVPKLDAVPEIPEEAHGHMVTALALLKSATSDSDYNNAGGEIQQALTIAPWWAEAYYNLAKIAEALKDYNGAIMDLKRYLLAKPQAEDARAVQDYIYVLEAKKMKATQTNGDKK